MNTSPRIHQIGTKMNISRVVIEKKKILGWGFTPTPNQEGIVHYVYVLKSVKDKELYTGSTRNLRRRFVDHNNGKVFSTKHRRPLELVYYEAYKSEHDARKREKNLKLRSRALTQLQSRITQCIT